MPPLEDVQDGIIVPQPASSSAVASGGGGKKGPREYSPCIGGIGEIVKQSYDPVGPQKAYVSWIIRFMDGNGKVWTKKRLLSDNPHGLLEPIAYLHAFRDAVLDGSITMIRQKPDQGKVDALVDTYRAEYQALEDYYG